MDDHAVKNSHPLNITFTVSKYPSKSLGQFLRKLRVEKGLEQKELAEKLQVHRNTVYERESDRHSPSAKNMEGLVRFFKVGAKTWGDFKTEKKRTF
jgi:transcriptional regulator with XRE-family HTH domain